MDMDYKSFILFLSVIQGIAAIRILNNFYYENPTLHEDADDERAILELKTQMHWLIGWLHGVYCEIKDNGYNDLFFIDGKTVKKHACSTPGCGPKCYANGCLSFLRQSEYVLRIRCDQNLLNVLTTDSDTAEMHIRISKNQEPKVFIDPGDVSIVASEAYANRIIERVSYTDADSDAVTLTCTGSDNFRLFQESGRRTIVLVKDLLNEKSNTFTVNISAKDRRNTVTQSLEIRLIGTTTTTTITPASSDRVTPQPSIEVPVLTVSTNRVSEELVTPQPSIEVPVLTVSINRVTEELVTPQPTIEVSILTDGNPTVIGTTTTATTTPASSNRVTPQPSVEVPFLTASTNGVTDKLVTPQPSTEVPVLTASTNQVTEELVTPQPTIEVSILTDGNPTGDRNTPNKDILNTVIYIIIPLAVFAIVTVAAVIIFWRKRHSRMKENFDDLDEAHEAGIDNPTYGLITSEKT